VRVHLRTTSNQWEGEVLQYIFSCVTLARQSVWLTLATNSSLFLQLAQSGTQPGATFEALHCIAGASFIARGMHCRASYTAKKDCFNGYPGLGSIQTLHVIATNLGRSMITPCAQASLKCQLPPTNENTQHYKEGKEMSCFQDQEACDV
jgi:hypothetical protein